MNAPFHNHVAAIELADLGDGNACAEIEAFVARMKGNVFQRPAWIRAVEQGTGQRAIGVVARTYGAITGWLPLSLIASPLFGRSLVSSGFGVGGGVLTDDSHVVDLLCTFAQDLALQHRCAAIEIRDDLAPLGWDMQTSSHADFSCDLAGDDDSQLLAIRRKQRAEIRKALGNNLDVVVGCSAPDQAAHYAVYAESVRNLGTPVFPKTLFSAMIAEFGDAIDILTIWHEGVPVSSVLSFYHNGVVMPFWGGGIHAARALRANDLMYFALMCHARAQKGCSRFDFGRSKADSGAYLYKRNWGMEPKPITYRMWTAPGQKARDINPSSPSYARKVALWKKLPLPIANAIGPYIARGLG